MQEHEFTRIERAPAYRLVYDALEREIFAGRLRAGDPLPAETQLAEQLGVNRSTVREGIRLLEQSGLVERNGAKRPRISVPALSGSRLLGEPRADPPLRDLPRTVGGLDGARAVHCRARRARTPTQTALPSFRPTWKQMNSAVQRIESGGAADVIGFVGLDREFHEILAKIAGNRVLALAHEPVTSLFIPAGQIILPRLKTYRRVFDAHRYIFECLQQAGRRRRACLDAQAHGRLPPRL